MNDYLYHGVKWKNYDLLVKILESGYILPRCMLEEGLVTDRNNIFNGTKYISLCKKTLIDFDLIDAFSSSYDSFIVNSPCLVLKNNNLNLIHPRIITAAERESIGREEWQALLYRDDDERLTYFVDELQSKDPISLKDNLVAVGLPLDDLEFGMDIGEREKILTDISTVLKKKGYDVPLLDSCMYSFADNEESMNRSKIKSRF